MSGLVGAQPSPHPVARGTYDILLNCLSTLIHTSLIVVRSNVSTSTLYRHTTQISSVALGLFMPFIALWSAVSQWGRARIIRDRVNAAAARLHLQNGGRRLNAMDTEEAVDVLEDSLGSHEVKPMWWQRLVWYLGALVTKTKHLFRRVFGVHSKYIPLELTRDGSTTDCKFERWTLVHGFYADIGGYKVNLPSSDDSIESQTDGRSVSLTATAVVELAEQHEMFDLINLPSAQIGETMQAAKWGMILGLARAIYFALTCIHRSWTGYTVSILEVITTAHVFISLCTQIFWWYKPPYVQDGRYLDVAAERALTNLPQELKDQLEGNSNVAYAYTVPKRLGAMLWNRADDNTLDITREFANVRACIVFLMAGLYAAIHLLPWKIFLPSPTDASIWYASLYYIIGLASTVFLLAALDYITRLLMDSRWKTFRAFWSQGHLPRTIVVRDLLNMALYPLVTLAVFAMLSIYLESAWSLREQPEDLYHANPSFLSGFT